MGAVVEVERLFVVVAAAFTGAWDLEVEHADLLAVRDQLFARAMLMEVSGGGAGS